MSSFTYNDAHDLFHGRRKTYNRVKCHRYGYLMYDEATDEYTINIVGSRYRTVTDPITKLNSYVSVGPAEFEMKVVARISRDKVTLCSLGSRVACEMWGVRIVKSASIMNNPYEAWRGAQHVPVDLNKPLEIVNDRLLPNTVELQRVFDKTKQKEVNALIAKVRRYIVQREKLGAFKPWFDGGKEQAAEFEKRYGPPSRIVKDAETLLAHLTAIDPANLETFAPLFSACTQRTWQRGTGYTTPSFAQGYARLVSNHREALRQHCGEVSYVPVSDLAEAG